MWRILHQFRQRGVNFRRQVQLGTYYADFACYHPSIVIEVDGSTHGSELAASNDATRDDYFRGRGLRVLRFWNGDVMHNPEGVFRLVEAELAKLSPDMTREDQR